MSKLLDLKLAYLETDIRQNLPDVIVNYVSFNEKVKEADKTAFINYEFKRLLERLKQIRKDGATEVAPTDAAAPKLGHRTAVPYPEGGIDEGIKVGTYVDQTLANLLEENLSNDIQDFYTFKERSSSFISTLLSITDLQSATLEDFDKLVCSKEITKTMKPLSKLKDDTLPFFIENYLKEDDAIFINTRIRDNTETYIHIPIITELAKAFNRVDEDTYIPVFKIENGIQPFASTLRLDSTEELERMQQGFGVEVAMEDNDKNTLFSSDDEALFSSFLDLARNDKDIIFENIQWLKEYLRLRILEKTYASEISSIVPLTPVPMPEDPDDPDYDADMEAYNQYLEDQSRLSSLITNLLSIESKTTEEDYAEKTAFLSQYMIPLIAGIYYGPSYTLDENFIRENFSKIFPDKRQTRIKEDIAKFNSGLLVFSTGDTFESLVMYRTQEEQVFYDQFASIPAVKNGMERMFHYFMGSNYGANEIYRKLNQREYYEKCFDLKIALKNYEDAYDVIGNLINGLSSYLHNLSDEEATYPDTMVLADTVDTFSTAIDSLLACSDAILEIASSRKYTLKDLKTYADANFSNGYDITLDEDRGVLRIIKKTS